MTVLPGSLDNLYYAGILDHIPYEAYEILPATYSGMHPYESMPGFSQNRGSLKQAVLGGGLNGLTPQMSLNGSQYLDLAQQGNLYSSQANADSFAYSNNSSNEFASYENNLSSNFNNGGVYDYNNNFNNGYNAGYVNNDTESTFSSDGNGFNSTGINGQSNVLGQNVNSSGNKYGIVGNAYDKNNSNYGNGIGVNDVSGSDFKKSLMSEEKSSKNPYFTMGNMLKGLLATSLLIATPILIVKGVKHAKGTKSGFLSKLNPINWFKTK